MKKNYIKAVYDLILKGDAIDVVLMNLARVLKQKGHESIHSAILEGVHKQLTVSTGSVTSVTVRTHADVHTYADAISKNFALLGTVTTPAVREDATLIGGYIVEHDHTRIDRSHKTKLVNLYRNITR